MNKNRALSLIAKRFLLSKHKTGMISFFSYSSIIGIAIGVFALVISLSVLNGFEEVVTRRITELDANIRITAPRISPEDVNVISRFLESRSVQAEVVPYLSRKVVLVSGNTNVVARSRAVDSDLFEKTSPFNAYLVKGDMELDNDEGIPGIVLGFRLAGQLGVDIFDTLSLVSPLDVSSTFDIPPYTSCIVKGIYRVDILDYDEAYCFIPLQTGRHLFRMGEYFSAVDIFFRQEADVDALCALLKNNLPDGFRVSSWRELHRDLYDAMQMEKWGTFFALLLIVLVASFNMMSGMVMMIMERMSQIGILKALGLSGGDMRRIFLQMGIFTLSIGIGMGMFLSILLIILQERYGMIPLPGDVYFISTLPMILRFFDLLMVVLFTVVIVVLASLYPSWKASRLSVVEAIYFER